MPTVVPDSRPCACGGTITVLATGLPTRGAAAPARRIQIAVAMHRRTAQHQAWSGPLDLARGPLALPPVDITPLAFYADEDDAAVGFVR